MIYEAVIATKNNDGSPHLAPLGYRLDGQRVVLAPFVPSNTLNNLTRNDAAVLSFTDDVRVIAGCLTGHREWELKATEHVQGWRLANCLAFTELLIVEVEQHDQRPKFYCEIRAETSCSMFRGFNRAQAAVVEAAILVTRLDWLESEKVAAEMKYLSIAIDKTAGPKEQQAWNWLVEAIEKHPLQHLAGKALRLNRE